MKHPNALAAGTSGGFGTLIVWLLDTFAGLEIDATLGAAIAAAVVVVVLFVGRRGLVGLAKLLWRGDPTL